VDDFPQPTTSANRGAVRGPEHLSFPLREA
jgi:hypothetical protein